MKKAAANLVTTQDDLDELSWPPPHEITVNKRAKRITLRVSAKKGLQITIPRKADVALAFDFVTQKRAWIEKQFAMLQNQKEDSLPTEINLLALNQCWKVSYQTTATKNKIQFIVRNQELVLYGDINNHALCRAALREFIRIEAKKNLLPWLNQLSTACRLPFSSASIRAQQTRWGSCTRLQKISLNLKLLFLPAAWTEYVLIHELCHVRHLDHSERFWNLMQTFVPNYNLIRKQMKQAQQYIPSWLEN